MYFTFITHAYMCVINEFYLYMYVYIDAMHVTFIHAYIQMLCMFHLYMHDCAFMIYMLLSGMHIF